MSSKKSELIFLDYNALETASVEYLFAESNYSESDISSEVKPKRVTILGLGDVGRTLAVGLKLIASSAISEIGIYDLDEKQCQRVALELAQITALDEYKINIKICNEDDLFDCDIFIFTAAAAVPAVGSGVKDVRLVQLAKNAIILKKYIKIAKDSAYKGELFIMSDPVDLLSKVALEEAKHLGYKDLSADKICGFGLGVMYARALYYAGQMGLSVFADKGRVYGAHGSDLVVLNDIFGAYDDALSRDLTTKVIKANLAVRELGFKPYIAPALSSGALTITALLEGRWQHSAVAFGDIFWGLRYRRVTGGIVFERLASNESIKKRLEVATCNLEKLYENYRTERA